jgi:hypothetical protein
MADWSREERECIADLSWEFNISCVVLAQLNSTSFAKKAAKSGVQRCLGFTDTAGASSIDDFVSAVFCIDSVGAVEAHCLKTLLWLL